MRRDEISLLEALRLQHSALTTDELTALIVCRNVSVDGELITDPKQSINRQAVIEVIREQRYVSRGGEKLEGALTSFGLSVTGLTLLDAGSSTGGFTDCLLTSGATLVHAVDVGYNQLDWKLRSDERVRVMERTNIMAVSSLDPQPDAAVCDLSFRSIAGAARHILSLCKEGGWLIALIKPQFEVPKGVEGFDGVIKDQDLLIQVMESVIERLITDGVGIEDLALSPITGAKGNIEFFGLLRNHQVLSYQTACERLTELLPPQ